MRVWLHETTRNEAELKVPRHMLNSPVHLILLTTFNSFDTRKYNVRNDISEILGPCVGVLTSCNTETGITGKAVPGGKGGGFGYGMETR